MKKTVVIGATPNSARYAYLASTRLKSYGHEIVPVGIRKGEIAGEEILDLRTQPDIDDVHTITLYIGPQNQDQWEDYILSLKPKRIIFNPGTESRSLYAKAQSQGIETAYACTLVMLSAGTY